MYRYNRPYRSRLPEGVPVYDVYRISADKYNVVCLSLAKTNITKEAATRLCKELQEEANNNKRLKNEGKRYKYVAVRIDEGNEVEELKEKAKQINDIYKPRREKYMAELAAKKRAEIDRAAERYQKNRREYENHMAVTGWHYDNQQRVNEYKGTVRG